MPSMSSGEVSSRTRTVFSPRAAAAFASSAVKRTLPAAAPGEAGAAICVYDRASQFDLLRSVPGSYMWVSPVPFDTLAREGLVQKPCRSGNVYCDALISRARLTDVEQSFVAALKEEIAMLPSE